MRLWGHHLAFFERASRLAMLGERLYGQHLISPNLGSGELEMLVTLGAPWKNITIVAEAERLLELEEVLVLSQLLEPDKVLDSPRCIADDLNGAFRDRRRALVTARLDANGPLTDVFADRVRNAVAHGMAEEGLLTAVFSSLDTMENTALIASRKASTCLTGPRDEFSEGSEEIVRNAVGQVVDLQHYLEARLGTRSVWEPEVVQIYELLVPGIYEIVVCGPVRRAAPREMRRVRTAEISFRAHPISAQIFLHNEELLRRGLRNAVEDLAKAAPGNNVSRVLSSMFHLNHDEVEQWINETPPPPSTLSSSVPSSSPTSPSASRRSRLFRG